MDRDQGACTTKYRCSLLLNKVAPSTIRPLLAVERRPLLQEASTLTPLQCLVPGPSIDGPRSLEAGISYCPVIGHWTIPARPSIASTPRPCMSAGHWPGMRRLYFHPRSFRGGSDQETFGRPRGNCLLGSGCDLRSRCVTSQSTCGMSPCPSLALHIRRCPSL